MKYVIALTAVALASASSLVLADAGAPGAAHRGAFMERLKAADTDGNGMISKDEATKSLPRIAANFDAIDANHDGQITVDELHAYMKSQHGNHAGHAFKSADANGDGKVTREEFLAAAAARFDRMDANKDGVLTPDEIKAGHHRGPRGAGQ